MRKILHLIILLSAGILLNAQTFVSTEPSDKNVILEEFTGVNCVFCPDGHRLANQIVQNNLDRVWTINIHQGHFADVIPDYRTEFGDAIAEQINLTGYPAGTVNRHLFPELSAEGTAVDRYDWDKATAQILSQSSYVNVAAISHLDFLTRALIINVEIYYTGNSPAGTNKLNVALLQSNILGEQSGMWLNPDQVIGELYSHNHMLRHLLTGQWGEDIETTAEGSFISRTYTYDVPEQINDVPINLEDLEIIVFVAEGTQEIITGAKSELYIDHIKPKMTALTEIETYSCNSEIQVIATINNTMYDREITSLSLEYEIDGRSETFNWDGTIEVLETKEIPLPLIPVVSGETHTIKVRLTGFNDGEEIDNIIPFEVTTSKAIVSGKADFNFVLVTDRYGSQNSFKFFDASGNVVFKGGPFTNLNYDGTSQRKFTFSPEEGGCYKLEVYDTDGDGINCGHGEGYFKLIDADEYTIIHDDGQFGYQADYYISVYKDVSVLQHASDAGIKIYPNPVDDVLYIDGKDGFRQVDIINLQGQLIKSVMNKNNKIPVDDLSPGTYIIRINTNEGTVSTKIVKK